ncbi:Metalloendopeptidase [Meloidogyne graminicola]|uniref:Metalloendopeptidase n=1 Tax=Meloidogyne graminicola TaxID=189291 RepID=A0A8S9ZS65_9BILA|nr:Metalloendopeptidase [Meloidogyne graminicola]
MSSYKFIFLHINLIIFLEFIILIFLPIQIFSCSTCPFDWSPPLEGRSRSEGIIGGITDFNRIERNMMMGGMKINNNNNNNNENNNQMNLNSWSTTEWTMQPWSWSIGTEITLTSTTISTTTINNLEQENKRPNIEKIKEIFCIRNPNNPSCQTIIKSKQHLIPQLSSSQSLNEEPKIKPMPFGYLDIEARDIIIKNCQNGIIDCKSQPFGMEQKLNMVIQNEMDFARKQYSSSYLSPELISKRVDLILQLKQKMLRVAGLGEYVTPVNDGTFEHDILLTENQALNLINALDQTPNPSNNKKFGYGHGRIQRSSLFLDQLETQKWSIEQPIKFYIDENIGK